MVEQAAGPTAGAAKPARHSAPATRTQQPMRAQGDQHGGALLAVLWLAAALSAIAFSVAATVRGEIDRTATAVDGTRAYYLAAGAIERAGLYMIWPGYWERRQPRLHFSFPTGEAIVEIIPATAKLNINAAGEQDLFRLLAALGAEPARAAEIAAAILDWRSQMPQGGLSFFDQHYLSLTPSFRARHASFEEVEELLLLKGMTPELFYGTYLRDAGGRLVRRAGLKDCVSVYGSTGPFDVNTAEPALLAAIGVYPEAVQEIVRMRQAGPIQPAQLATLRQFGGPGAQKLTIGGNSIYTLRATARVRTPNGGLSDLRRTVSATVKLWGATMPPYHVLRWYDQAANGAEWP